MYDVCTGYFRGVYFSELTSPGEGDEKSKGNFFILFDTNYPKIN